MEVGLGGGPGGCRCCGRLAEKDQDGNKDDGDRIVSVVHVRVSNVKGGLESWEDKLRKGLECLLQR